MDKTIVTIGGGGGHAALAQAVAPVAATLTCVTNTADDGGSSGILMQEYGVHMPGEVVKLVAALSPSLGNLMRYRFGEGSLSGHTVGNIVLSALELSAGDQQRAIDQLCQMAGAAATVMPATVDGVVLETVFESGETVSGQRNLVLHLESKPTDSVSSFSLSAGSMLSSGAADAIQSSDLVVVAMGDLYSSIAPPLGVPGMSEALSDRSGKLIWFVNSVAPVSHAHYKTVRGALSFLQSICPAFVPDVIVCHDGSFTKEEQEGLAEAGYQIVEHDIAGEGVILSDLVDHTVRPVQSAGDIVRRSPIMYDTQRITDLMERL